MGAAALPWLVPALIGAGTTAYQVSESRRAKKEADVARDDEIRRQEAIAADNRRLADEARQRELDAYNQNQARLETAKSEAARQIESSFANQAAKIDATYDDEARALLARRNIDPSSPLGRAATKSASREKIGALDTAAGGRAAAMAGNTSRFAEALSSLRAPGYQPYDTNSYASLLPSGSTSDAAGLGSLGGQAFQLAGYEYGKKGGTTAAKAAVSGAAASAAEKARKAAEATTKKMTSGFSNGWPWGR